MATTSTPVRKLTQAEISIVAMSLELQAKSSDRAARASTNSVIADEHAKQAAMCRNLSTHCRNGSLDV